MKNSKLFASIFVLAAASATACNQAPVETNPDPAVEECHDADKAGCEIVSDKQRLTSVDVPVADQKSLTGGNTAFALDLYQQVRKKEGNIFYSPFSISEALAMTWAGAKNQTAKDMATALHFDLPAAQLHPAFDYTVLEMALMGRFPHLGAFARCRSGSRTRPPHPRAAWRRRPRLPR